MSTEPSEGLLLNCKLDFFGAALYNGNMLRWTAIVLYTFIMSSVLFAAESTVLSLDTFIKTSLKKHPLVGSFKSGYYASLYQQTAQRQIYDTNFFLTAYYEKGNLNTFTGSFNDEGVQATGTAGVQKRLAKFGADLELSASHSRQLNNPSFSGFSFPDAYVNTVTLSLRKSLYQNLTGLIDQYPIRAAEINLDMSKIIYQSDLQNFVGTLTKTYLEWRHRTIRHMILRKQLNNADKQVALMTRQFKRGSTELRELLQAKQQAKQQQLLLLAEEQQLQSVTRLLYYYMNGKQLQGNFEMVPEDIPLYFKTEQARAKDLNSYPLALLSLQKRLAELHRDYSKEQEKRQIDLVGAVSQTGVGSTLSDATETISDNTSFQLGLEMGFPVLNRRLKNQTRSSASTKEMLRLQEEALEQELASLQNQLYESHEQLTTISAETETFITLSQDRAREESKAYRQGRLPSLYVVIQAQNQTLSAELQAEDVQHQLYILQHQIALLENDYARYYKLEEL